MPFARSNDAAIHWTLEGDAANPPLVLLNSIGTDMGLWASVLPALRPRFQLLRIDMRGHGRSDVTGGDYALGTLAADVSTVMEAAGFRTAAVAGVSLGGMVAMQLALDAPGRVSALALVCTSATMDRGAWATRVDTVRGEGMSGIVDLAMSRFLSAGFTAAHPEIAATVRQGLLAMDPAGYAGCAAAIRDMTIAPCLHEITCPTLVVTGLRDSSTPFAGHGENLVARIGGARHVALDAGHLAPLEAPDALADAIAAFIGR